MTKQDLKQLILEVYIEENKKKNAAKESDVAPTKKKVVAPVKKKVVAPAKKDPDNKITQSLLRNIETQEKSNLFKGDKVDAELFKDLGIRLKKFVGREFVESDVDKMLEDMQCDECCEESAKPDFLDLDNDGNKIEPMKKAAFDNKKIKEIIEKAKNI